MSIYDRLNEIRSNNENRLREALRKNTESLQETTQDNPHGFNNPQVTQELLRQASINSARESEQTNTPLVETSAFKAVQGVIPAPDPIIRFGGQAVAAGLDIGGAAIKQGVDWATGTSRNQDALIELTRGLGHEYYMEEQNFIRGNALAQRALKDIESDLDQARITPGEARRRKEDIRTSIQNLTHPDQDPKYYEEVDVTDEQGNIVGTERVSKLDQRAIDANPDINLEIKEQRQNSIRTVRDLLGDLDQVNTTKNKLWGNELVPKFTDQTYINHFTGEFQERSEQTGNTQKFTDALNKNWVKVEEGFQNDDWATMMGGVADFVVEATPAAGEWLKNLGESAINEPVGATDLAAQFIAEIRSGGYLNKLVGASKANMFGHAVIQSLQVNEQAKNDLKNFLDNNERFPTPEERANMRYGQAINSALGTVEMSTITKIVNPIKATPITEAKRILGVGPAAVASRVGNVALTGAGTEIPVNIVEQTMMRRGDTDFTNIDAQELSNSVATEVMSSTAGTAPGLGANFIGETYRDVKAFGDRGRAQVNQEGVQTGNIAAPTSEVKYDPEFNYGEYAATIVARNAQPTATTEEKLKNQTELQAVNISLMEEQEQYNAIIMEYEQTPKAQRTEEQTAAFKEAKKKATDLEKNIKTVSEAIASAASISVISQDEANTLADRLVNSPVDDVNAPPLAQQIVQAVQNNIGAFDIPTLQKVLQSPVLSPSQRSYLESVITAKENKPDEDLGSLREVSGNILVGSEDGEWRGLQDHRNSMNKALATGNVSWQNRLQARITKLSEGHGQKARDFEAAANVLKFFDRKKGFTPEEQAAIDRVEQNYVQENGDPYFVTKDGKPFFDFIGFNDKVQAEQKGIEAMKAEFDSLLGIRTEMPSQRTTTPSSTPQPAASTPVTPAPQASAPVNNQAQQPADAGVTSSPMATFTNHSGGAIGSDSAWDGIGKSFGVSNHKHYQSDSTPLGNVTLTPEQIEEGLAKAKQGAKDRRRNFPNSPYSQRLLARNWFQVKNSDAVFAIAKELEGDFVSGGTGHAVAMARREGKPVYAFDQSQGKWFEAVPEGWRETDTPVLTSNFAGIGTQQINEAGKQAIRDVYQKTQDSLVANKEPTGTPVQNDVQSMQEELAQKEAELAKLDNLAVELKKITDEANRFAKPENAPMAHKIPEMKKQVSKRPELISRINELKNLLANEQAKSTVVDNEVPFDEPQAPVSTPTPATVEPEQSASEPRKTAKKAKEKPVLTAEEIAAKKEATREKLRAAWKRRQIVRPEVDELLTAIAKLGGVRRSEVNQFSDDFGMRRNGIRWVFTKNGLTLDQLIEKLTENDPDGFTGGYLSKDATTSDLADLIGSSISGTGNYTAEGAANKAELEAELDAIDTTSTVNQIFDEDTNYDEAQARAILLYNEARNVGISQGKLNNLLNTNLIENPVLLVTELTDLISEKLNGEAANRSSEAPRDTSENRGTEESTSGIGRTSDVDGTGREERSLNESVNQEDVAPADPTLDKVRADGTTQYQAEMEFPGIRFDETEAEYFERTEDYGMPPSRSPAAQARLLNDERYKGIKPTEPVSEYLERVYPIEERGEEALLDADDLELMEATIEEDGDGRRVHKLIKDLMKGSFSLRVRRFFSVKGVGKNPLVGVKVETNDQLTGEGLEVAKGFFHLSEDSYIENIEKMLGRELNEKQSELFKDLRKFHMKLVNYVKTNPPKFNKKGKYQENINRINLFNQLLYNADGTLNDNVIGAVSVATYQWLATSAGTTTYRTKSAIGSFLGLKENQVTGDMIDYFADLGVPESLVTKSIGSNIIQALKIGVQSYAPGEMKNKLELEAAQFALWSLITPSEQGGLGLLSVQLKPTLEVDSFRTKEFGKKKFETKATEDSRTIFLRAITTVDETTGGDVLIPEIKHFNEQHKNTDDILSEVFGTSNRTQTVSLTPIEKVGKFYRGTTQKVPEAVNAILEKAQSTAWVGKEYAIKPLMNMSEGMQRFLFGETIKDNVMADREKAHKSKNDAALKNLEHFKNTVGRLEAVENPAERKFYIPYFLESRGRIYMGPGDTNPQANKPDRGLFGIESWKTTINLNNQDQVDIFKLALAEAFDLDRDKNFNADTLEAVNNFIKRDDVIQAARAIYALKNNPNLNDAQKAAAETAIRNVLANAKDRMHMYEGLATLSDFFAAKNSSDKTFETMIMPEVDGVANGIILGMLLFAGGMSVEQILKIIEKGGLFSDKTKNLAEWKAATKKADTYQTTSNSLQDAMQATRDYLVKAGNKHRLAVMDTIIRNFGKHIKFSRDDDGNVVIEIGRTAGKEPTMVTIYGSGSAAVISSLVEGFRDIGFLEVIRDQLEAAADNNDIAEANRILDDFSLISGMKFEKVNTAQEIYAIRIRQTQELSANIADFIGEPLAEAIQGTYGVFIQNRGYFNNVMNLANKIFVTLLEKRIAQRREELQKLDKSEREHLYPYEQLPQAEVAKIVQELKEAMPIINTFNSASEGGVDAGITFAQTTKQPATNEKGEAVLARTPKPSENQKFLMNNGQDVGSAFSEKKVPYKRKGETEWKYKYERQTSLMQGVTVTGYADEIGVRAAIGAIHNTDSSIAGLLLKVKEVLSVHDGFGSKVGDEISTAEELNRATMEVLKFDVAMEAINTLNRAIKVFMEQTKDLPVNERNMMGREILKAVNDITNKGKPKSEHITFRTVAEGVAFYTDKLQQVTDLKNQVLEKITYANQYYMENGYFATEAGKKLDAENAPPKNKEEMNKLLDQDDITPKIPASPRAPAKDRSDSIGSIGMADVPVNMEIAGMLKTKNTARLDQVLDRFSVAKTSMLYRALIRAVKNLPGVKEITVVAVKVGDPNQSAADFSKLYGLSLEEGTAVFEALSSKYSDEGVLLSGAKAITYKNKIYLRYHDGDNGYSDHGINDETILHEMLHGITLKAIFGSNPNHVAIKNLQVIIEAIKDTVLLNTEFRNKYGKDFKVITDIENPLQAAAELVSWGMTNHKIQEGLSKVKVDGRKLKNLSGTGLLTALQAVADTIMDLFGLNRMTEEDGFNRNALSQLILATSSLINSNDGTSTVTNEIPLAQQFGPRDNAEEAAMDMSPTEIFDSLSVAGEPTRSDLRQMVERLSESLPIGLIKIRNMRRGIYNTTDDFLDAVINNRVRFVNRANAVGFNLNDQEQFAADQIEVSIAGALNNGADKARVEMDKLYALAKKQIKVEDFAQPHEDMNDPNTAEIVEKRYNYIFNPIGSDTVTIQDSQSPTGQQTKQFTDYLARFAAMGATFKPFNDALSKLSTSDTTEGKVAFSEKLRRLINDIASFLGVIIGKETRSDKMSNRVNQLVEDLASINTRHKQTVVNKIITSAENALDSSNNFMKDKVEDLNEVLVTKGWGSTSGVIRRWSTVPMAVLKGQVGDHFEAMKRTAQRLDGEGRQGFFMNLGTEVGGQNQHNSRVHKLFRFAKHSIDQGRRHANQWGKEYTNAQFSRDLTDDEKINVTKILLKTDLQSLIDNNSFADIVGAIENDAKRQLMIDIIKQEIYQNHPDLALGLENHSKSLGYYMVSGDNIYGSNLALNAAVMLNDDVRTQNLSVPEWKALKNQVDQLISLYALEYSSNKSKRDLQQLINDERNRTDGINGLENTLMLHKKLVKDAYETRFDKNETLMIKGFIADLKDERVQVRYTEKLDPRIEHDKAILDDMARRGYVIVNQRLRVDSDIATPEKMMWMSQNDAMAQMNAGAVSYHSSRNKGSILSYNGTSTITSVKAAKAKRGNKISKLPNFDPRNVKAKYSVPLRNDQGDIVEYRYMMNDAAKENYLGVDLKLDNVIGKMSADLISKNETERMNKMAVQVMKDQYAEDRARGIRNFIEISPNSNDPKAREAWGRLPYEMKKEIERVWGGEAIYIRNDLENIMFGYRSPTIAGIWDVPEEHRTMFQRTVVNTIEMAARMAGVKDFVAKTKTVEEVWTDLIREVKDIWVIKNVFTLVGNISSNTTVLFVEGLGPIEALRKQLEGYNLITRYQKDSKELNAFETDLELEQSRANPDAKKIRQLQGNINVLKDKIGTNPITDLVDAGMFQTIIEDIDMNEDDEGHYRKRIADQLDRVTSRIPEGVRSVGREILMTKRSKIYRSLNHLTQVSDLAARYTLYNRLITRKNNPLTREAAVNQTVEQFVNYDIPSHVALEFANKYGILWFTKYYLRTQKILFRMMRENPARMAMLLTGEALLNDLDSIHDSWLTPSRLLGRFRNPIESIFTAPEDLITMHLIGEAL